MTAPDGRVPAYGYDVAGNLTTASDFYGNTTTFQYDANNYLVSMTTGDKTTQFAYGGEGSGKKISSVTDALGWTTRYDQADATTVRVVDPRGGVWEYENEDGKTGTTTDPLGRTTSRVYKGGNLAAYLDGNANLRNMGFDARGNMVSWQGTVLWSTPS